MSHLEINSRYIPPINAEELLVKRRVADVVKAVHHSHAARYLGFYSLREKELAIAELRRLKWRNFSFHGGFDGAEREMLCVFDKPGEEEFPIVFVFITIPKGISLTHRDYLGAVLSIGLRRDCVGDILVRENGALVSLKDSVSSFACEALTTVGSYSVSVKAAIPDGFLWREDEPSETGRSSVASLRLDAVLAAMLHKSRAEAVAAISRGAVLVNHVPVESPHYAVEQGDVFSVRGVGRFCVDVVGGKTKKNRVWLQYVRY